MTSAEATPRLSGAVASGSRIGSTELRCRAFGCVVVVELYCLFVSQHWSETREQLFGGDYEMHPMQSRVTRVHLHGGPVREERDRIPE
jgi:hypothetical protein